MIFLNTCPEHFGIDLIITHCQVLFYNKFQMWCTQRDCLIQSVFAIFFGVTLNWFRERLFDAVWIERFAFAICPMDGPCKKWVVFVDKVLLILFLTSCDSAMENCLTQPDQFLDSPTDDAIGDFFLHSLSWLTASITSSSGAVVGKCSIKHKLSILLCYISRKYSLWHRITEGLVSRFSRLALIFRVDCLKSNHTISHQFQLYLIFLRW